MRDGKSKLLQAARRVRDEIYSSVKADLQDDTRTYQMIAEANCISVATVQRIAGSLGISRPAHNHLPRRSPMETTEKKIPTYVYEDLLFRRRLQRSLNAEYEKLSALLVEQVRLLKERDALMDGVHESVNQRWRDEEEAASVAVPTQHTEGEANHE